MEIDIRHMLKFTFLVIYNQINININVSSGARSGHDNGYTVFCWGCQDAPSPGKNLKYKTIYWEVIPFNQNFEYKDIIITSWPYCQCTYYTINVVKCSV